MVADARRRSVKTPGPLSRMTPAKGALTGRKSRVDTPRVRRSSVAPKQSVAGRLSRVAEKPTGIPMPRKSVRKSTVTAPRKSGPILRKSVAAPKSGRKSTTAPKSGRKSVAKKSVGGRKSVAKKSVGGRKSAVKKSLGGRKSKPKRDSMASARDSVASMKSAVSIEPPKRKRNSVINRKMTARMNKELEPEADYDLFADEEPKNFKRLSFYERKRKNALEAAALKKAQEEAHDAVEMPKKKAKAKGRPKKAAKKPAKKGRK